MGILSYGTATSDVEVMLGLGKAIDPVSAEGLRTIMLVNSVESDIRALTGRAFEQATYADFAIDGPLYPTSILTLPDRPVITWTGAKQVMTRDAVTGAPVSATNYTILRDGYVVDTADGTVRMLGGYWPTGPQALLFSGVLGYTSAQILAGTAGDIPTLKALLSSVLQREWWMFKLSLQHVTAMSLGDESVSSFRTQYTQTQWMQIGHLKMRGF